MTSGIEHNTLPIWRSPQLLETFFKGQQAVETIKEVSRSNSPPLLAGRWKLTMGIEIQAYAWSACVWRIMSLIVYMFSENLYKHCVVNALHDISHAASLKCQRKFKEHFLCSSINTYRHDGTDIYLRPKENEGNPNYPLFGAAGFFNANGLCRGISFWFLYLYFQTKSNFTDPERHMKAITQQFSQGAPAQAALLHLFNPRLTPRPVYRHLPLLVTEFFKRFSTERMTHRGIASQMNTLAPGAYAILSSKHQFVWIKIDDQMSFLFDPNYGCFSINGSLSLEKVLPLCLSTHDYTRDIVIDHVTPLMKN